MAKVSDILRKQGVTKIANAMGLPLQTVSSWGHRNKVPADKVIELERLTGVSRHKLRPDVFGKAPQQTEAC